jgi:hypothetical protein
LGLLLELLQEFGIFKLQVNKLLKLVLLSIKPPLVELFERDFAIAVSVHHSEDLKNKNLFG